VEADQDAELTGPGPPTACHRWHAPWNNETFSNIAQRNEQRSRKKYNAHDPLWPLSYYYNNGYPPSFSIWRMIRLKRRNLITAPTKSDLVTRSSARKSLKNWDRQQISRTMEQRRLPEKHSCRNGADRHSPQYLSVGHNRRNWLDIMRVRMTDFTCVKNASSWVTNCKLISILTKMSAAVHSNR